MTVMRCLPHIRAYDVLILHPGILQFSEKAAASVEIVGCLLSGHLERSLRQVTYCRRVSGLPHSMTGVGPRRDSSLNPGCRNRTAHKEEATFLGAYRLLRCMDAWMFVRGFRSSPPGKPPGTKVLFFL